MKISMLALLLVLVSASFAYTTPYWLHDTNNAIPVELWARQNLSATAYETYVYYSGSTNRSNGSLVFDFFDSALEDKSGNYSATGNTSQLYWNPTEHRYEHQYSGESYIAPTTFTNRSSKDYVVEADIGYLVENYNTLRHMNGIAVIGYANNQSNFVKAQGAATHAGIGNGVIATLEVGNVYADQHAFNLSYSTTYPLRSYLKGSTTEAFSNATYPQNNTIFNSSAAAVGTGGYIGIYISSSNAYFKNLREWDYTPTPTIVYGSEESGSWYFGGETYTKRRQINITSTGTNANSTFQLDYSYFSNPNILISNSSPDESSLINISYAPNNAANGILSSNNFFLANATYTGYSDACRIQINGTFYAMTFSADGYCYRNNTALTDGNYGYFLNAYNSSNTSQGANTTNRTITIDTEITNPSFTNPSAATYHYLNATFNLTFTEPNLANCKIEIDGTNYTMSNVSSVLCSYQLNNTVGNITYTGWITDLAGHVGNTTLYSLYMFNASLQYSNFTNPEADLSADMHSLYVSLNNYPWDATTAMLEYNGINYSATLTEASGNANFSKLISPVAVSNGSTNTNFIWYVSFPYAPMTKTNTNNTVVVQSGLVICGTTSNISAIQYNTYDISNSLPVNSTLIQTIIETGNNITKTLTTNFSTANSTHFLCIYPTTLNVNASFTDIYSASGYYSTIINRISTAYSSTLISYSIGMQNSSGGSKPTIFYVKDNYYLPMSNVSIGIWQFNASAYFLVTTLTTNILGSAQTYLTPNTVIYHFNITNSSGYLLADYADQVVNCDTFDATCSIILIVGSSTTMPYTSTYGSQNGSCSFVNATGILTCATTGTTVATTNLTVTLINGTSSSTFCSTTGTTAPISCTLITTENLCYNYIFGAVLTSGERQTMVSGRICTTTSSQNWGVVGVMAAMLIVLALSLSGLYFGAAGACWGCALGLIVSKSIPFLLGIGWEAIIPMAFVMAIAGFLVR